MNATEIRTRFVAALDNILSDDEVPADARILPQALSHALVEYRLSAAKPGQDLTPADITVSDITEIDRLKAGDDALAKRSGQADGVFFSCHETGIPFFRQCLQAMAVADGIGMMVRKTETGAGMNAIFGQTIKKLGRSPDPGKGDNRPVDGNAARILSQGCMKTGQAIPDPGCYLHPIRPDHDHPGCPCQPGANGFPQWPRRQDMTITKTDLSIHHNQGRVRMQRGVLETVIHQ